MALVPGSENQGLRENMTQIPMTSRSRRPSFFDDSAADQLVTMMLEMMAELWVVKQRVHTLEKVLGEAGINASEQIEKYQLSEDDLAELEGARRKFVETIMRSLEADFVDRASLQKEMDELTDEMKSGAT
jgi:hypothetical protein